MSLPDSFQRAWDYQLLRYEGCKTPDFDCYDSSGLVTQETLEDGLVRVRRTIRDLENELERRRFVEQFISNVLRKIIVIDGLEIKNVKILLPESSDVSTPDVTAKRRTALQTSKPYSLDNNNKESVAGLCVGSSKNNVSSQPQLIERDCKIRLVAPETLPFQQTTSLSSKLDETTTLSCLQVRKDVVSRTLSEPSAASTSTDDGGDSLSNSSCSLEVTKSSSDVAKPRPRISRSKPAQAAFEKAIQDLATLNEDDKETGGATIASIFSRFSDSNSSPAIVVNSQSASSKSVPSIEVAMSSCTDGKRTSPQQKLVVCKTPTLDTKVQSINKGLASVSPSIDRMGDVQANDEQHSLTPTAKCPTKTESFAGGSPKILLRRKNTGGSSSSSDTKSTATTTTAISCVVDNDSTSNADISSSRSPSNPAGTVTMDSSPELDRTPKGSILRRKNTDRSESSTTTGGGAGAVSDEESSEDDQEMTLMVLRESVYRASQWCTNVDSSRTRLIIINSLVVRHICDKLIIRSPSLTRQWRGE